MTMKKIILMLAFIFIMSANSFAEYPFDGFEITSGIDTSKQSETTFDSSRTISGTALKGTVIYMKIESEKNSQEYTIEVGSSNYFSFSADFEEGANDLIITAEMPDGSVNTIETTVKRKNGKIKSQLESNIALPGESLKRGLK